MWYRLSQETQQTNDSQNIVSDFLNNINTILDKYSGNLSLMAFKLADLERKTTLPVGHDKSSLISQAIKSKNGDAGYPIEKSYKYYMSNPTAVPVSAVKEQQQNLQIQTPPPPPPPGSDTQEQPPIEQKNFTFKDSAGKETPIGGQYGYLGPQDMQGMKDMKWEPGFEPKYKLGLDGKPMLRPDGKPIVQGLKYDGSKQTPKPTWNPVSIQAAFKDSGVQFVMGGASQDHQITPQEKQEILQYLQTNKNEKNILLPDKLEGLNAILNKVRHKADTNDSGGVLFVERA